MDILTAVRKCLAELDTDEKHMFGGTGFMWRGNLVCSATKSGLLVRLGAEQLAEFSTSEGVMPMVMGGRTSTSWARVDADALTTNRAVTTWVRRAVSFVETLPAK